VAQISVVIPVRNAGPRLARTLASIAEADFDLARLEVVLADDGSSDGAVEAALEQRHPMRLVHRRGSWGSQSAATNEAIRHASGALLLLSAQDIVFHRSLLAEHRAWHERFPGEEVAVLGDLPYAPDLDVTPFMFYLLHGGFQFAYFLIQDPLRVPPNFAYAPNLSLRRTTLDRIGLFDEQFRYGCQDTDLGIRLHEAGVRLVFNRDAIGFHNHPVGLEDYRARQERVGEATFRLQQKHPSYEAGAAGLDVVVTGHLAYAQARCDLDRAQVRRLEGEVAGERDYGPLWQRAFCAQESLDHFSASEQRTLRLVDELFNAYHRLLQQPLAAGYLRAALAELGPEALRRMLSARLSKLQVSASTRRVIERRLRELSLPIALCSPADHLSTRVVHGITSYAGALLEIEPHLFPRHHILNQELVLVVDAAAATAEELSRLEESAEVLRSPEAGPGVLAALARGGPEIVLVQAAGLSADAAPAIELARSIFAQFPQVAVLGGGVSPVGGREVHYGHRVAGRRVEPLLRPAAQAGQPVRIDAAIPDYLVLRRSAVSALDPAPRPSAAVPWNVELCRRLAAGGWLTLHVPSFAAVQTRAGMTPACP
jgi:GT2 family glycosyltransferase